MQGKELRYAHDCPMCAGTGRTPLADVHADTYEKVKALGGYSGTGLGVDCATIASALDSTSTVVHNRLQKLYRLGYVSRRTSGGLVKWYAQHVEPEEVAEPHGDK